MLEVVFSQSAAGSMAVAMGRKSRVAGAVGIIVASDDGRRPSKAQVEKLRRQAEEREARNWENAVPLPGSRKDIALLPLALSVGEIDENGIGPKRRDALSRLMGIFPDLAEEVVRQPLDEARGALSRLLNGAAAGETIRVWASCNPDEACGLCWLAEQLRPIGFENLDVALVRLPDFEERPDGAAVQHTSWGEAEPHQWGRMAALAKKLPPNAVRALADSWRQLQKENAPLRAVLNGRLVSAPETLYDFVILRELYAQGDEFMETAAIGRVLGQQLGIGDAWVALRIEQFIRGGLFRPVSQPEPGGPLYRRMLRRCGDAGREPGHAGK